MVKVDPKAPVTNEKLDQAIDHIADIIQDFRDDVNKGFGDLRGEMNQRFDQIERRVDISPSRVEVDKLTRRVEQLEKLLHAS